MSAITSTLISATIVAAALSAPAILSGPSAPPRAGDTVLVVTPPWRDAAEAANEADGVVVALGVVPFIAAAYSPDADFVARLGDEGAAFVFNSSFGKKWLCR